MSTACTLATPRRSTGDLAHQQINLPDGDAGQFAARRNGSADGDHRTKDEVRSMKAEVTATATTAARRPTTGWPAGAAGRSSNGAPGHERAFALRPPHFTLRAAGCVGASRSFELRSSKFDLRATGALAVQERDLNADDDFGDDDEVVYYHSNTLFSIYALSDADENVIERYRYDAYGTCTVLDADFSDDADNASDVKNPYTFTARRLDAESELMQYRYRYYSVGLGRFISRDPMGYLDGETLYRYCGARTTREVDPLGAISEEKLEPFSGKFEWNVREVDPPGPFDGAPPDFYAPPGMPVIENEPIHSSIWIEYWGEVETWCDGKTPHIGEFNYSYNAGGWDDARIGIPIWKGIYLGYRYKRWAKCKETDSYPGSQTEHCKTTHKTITCRGYKRHAFFGGWLPPVKAEWPTKGTQMGEKEHHFVKTCCLHKNPCSVLPESP